MAVINQNNCNISNLRPLEVTCNPTNATSPEAQDGSIQLFINGGTSPYTVSWANGAQGTYIGNLQSGTYTATITDYYEDYTKTITCTVGNDTFYLDEFIKCSENFNPNIYVFYDGTSLNSTAAAQASESMRSWYQGKKDNGFGGLLYEGVIGSQYFNGENWLWWSLYPFLGSLTGGTLSDGTTVIPSFSTSGLSVNNSIYYSNFCKSNDNGKCVPKDASFNFSNDVAGGLNSDIYRRINNGFTLTGNYGSNDTRSMGVPFTVSSSFDGESEGIHGDFVGGDKNYICIIIADEANGDIGLYHGNITSSAGVPNKNDLFNNPFDLSGIGWSGSSQEPSNRFTYDYESFLKVWEDIKNEGGSFDGFMYPLIENNTSEIPFIQHTVAAVEGSTITESEFEEKYETVITNVGPQSLNLSALTTTNVYSGLTGTTAYQNLNSQYKNGSGLKNFDWEVDPTVSSLSNGVIGNKLNDYFSGISLSDEKIYTEPIENLYEDKIYKFSEVDGCYSYEQRLLSTGQTFSAVTVTDTYDECILCQPSSGNTPFQPTLCLSNGETQYQFNPIGVSSNYFVWENTENSLTLNYNSDLNRWEVTPWTNVGLGAMVREVNEIIPTGGFTNLGVTNSGNWVMTEGFCEGIPLTVTANPSNETCQGDLSGEVVLLGQGGSQPYQFRIQDVSPYPTYSNTGIFYNIPPGNYVGQILDFSGNTSSVNFSIQPGDISIQYTVSLTSTVTNNGSGTRTWNYGVQVNPSLPPGVELTFDIELSHTNINRDSGTANFSYLHTIYKNSSVLIPYINTTPVVNTYTTGCLRSEVEETTTTFKNVANSVTYNGSDTSLIGYVTQTVTVNGSTANCEPECRMRGTYNTSLQITNLSISGNECATVNNAFTPINENITIYDCLSQA